MNIDLKQFVDINIKQHVTSSVDSTRDTVVLFTADDTSAPNGQILITSLAQAETRYADKADTLAYLKMYFNNGGIKVLVIEKTDFNDLTTEMIANLDNKYICIAYAAKTVNLDAVYSKLQTIAAAREADSTIYGINEKILIACTTDKTKADTTKNFAVKYSNIQGAEMTIAAYLVKVDVYGLNTVYDYAFTKELITPEDITDADFKTITTNNMNVDIELANEVRNCGGNLKDGSDLINNYVRIILHQTLTDALITLLGQKIKNATGISKIYTTIAQELEKYLTCGYLTTDKVWTDNSLKITRNGVTYTIIEKGTPLTNGYNITVLPLAALTDAEKKAHSAPPIYVIIADQYGIRQITINGEVI